VRDDEVDELGNEFVWRRLAHEEPDMFIGVGSPREQDQKTDKDGTERVKVPYDFASDDRHGQTKGVDDDIIAVVHEEDVHRRVTAEEETIDA
jgi:hypothetical protein